MINIKTSSIDPHLLEELINNKLDEKSRIDKEIKYLIAPIEQEREEKSKTIEKASVAETSEIGATEKDSKRYQFRKRKPINYRE